MPTRVSHKVNATRGTEARNDFSRWAACSFLGLCRANVGNAEDDAWAHQVVPYFAPLVSFRIGWTVMMRALVLSFAALFLGIAAIGREVKIRWA